MYPKIGIVATAHRPQNWMALYNSIGDNDVEFELVFVGPNPPNYELPKNFRFIRSLVKPAQCAEIAVRNTSAELIMNIADDVEFNTLRPLDKLYGLYRLCNSDKAIVSSRYMDDGVDLSQSAQRFFGGDDSTPIMDLCGLMSKELYHKIGGIDKNFIAVMWPLDITMRVYAAGGRVVMSDVYVNEVRGKNAGSSLCSEFWKHDRGLLDSLWVDQGKVCSSRRKPIEPFGDLNILKISQGPRGRWRGKGFLFFEKIETNFPRVIRGIKRPVMYFSYLERMVLYIKKISIKMMTIKGRNKK